MITRLKLFCLIIFIVGLSACVAPEESDEGIILTVVPSAEIESSPLTAPSSKDVMSSPLESPILPTIPTALAPTDEESKIDLGSTEDMSEDQKKALEAAVGALTDKTKVSVDQIEVVSVKSVQFRDSSLGCPQKGMMYLQVITPGQQVILRLDNQTYDYRIAGKQVVLCEMGQ